MSLFDLKDKSRYASFSRRTLMLGGGMTAIFGALAARLYQLQIVNGSQFLTQAENNRVSPRLIPPPRGRILDRFAVELANDKRNFRILLTPEQAKQAEGGVDAVLDSIAKLIQLDERRRKKILRDIAENKPFLPITIAENLSWEQFARVSLYLPYLPGTQPDVGETRDYPYGAELSHVLGYVASVSPKDMENDTDALLSLPGFRVGKRGIEKEFDDQIRGSAGVSRVEVNAYGRVVRELGKEPSTPGRDVYLTIDQAVQNFASQRLGEESAACAVMCVKTGDVIALCSTPGYDPNPFNSGISSAEWKALMENDHKPLINKVIAGVYPPGSTFKPAMALAAMDAGLITPETSVVCTGGLSFGNRVFHCWKHGGHGTVNLHRGIKESCDVFFYEVARRLGIDRIHDAANKLGLGMLTGIDIPGERTGLIPSAAWKEATFGSPWQQGETLSVGIGQGYVAVTPLQLCTLAARLASGRALTPRLAHVVGEHLQPRPALAPLAFSQASFDAVRAGMNAVANEPGGTAHTWRIPDAGFEMAGKTGTAQVRVISKEEHARGVTRNENLPWKLRDHALFIAFAPVSEPRYACAVVIEHGAIGAHPQVQMARDILLFTQKRDPSAKPAAYPVTSASNVAGKVRAA